MFMGRLLSGYVTHNSSMYMFTCLLISQYCFIAYGNDKLMMYEWFFSLAFSYNNYLLFREFKSSDKSILLYKNIKIYNTQDW